MSLAQRCEHDGTTGPSKSLSCVQDTQLEPNTHDAGLLCIHKAGKRCHSTSPLRHFRVQKEKAKQSDIQQEKAHFDEDLDRRRESEKMLRSRKE
jgi:hypothetical protein